MKICSKMSVHVAAVVLLQVIGVSEAFFLAEMFGPSAELEAACPGSCQVRKNRAKTSSLVKCLPILSILWPFKRCSSVLYTVSV